MLDPTTPSRAVPAFFNPDNDRSYVRPRAWAKAKAAFGVEFRLKTLMKQLELLTTPADPRLHLDAALHFYLHLTADQQVKARIGQFDWLATELEFEAAMHSIAEVEHAA